MSSHSHDHDHSDTDPVTGRAHGNSWSANLENPQYETDRELFVQHTIDAVKQTTAGNHVNLVTHAEHGHPELYLYDPLAYHLNNTDTHWDTSNSVVVVATSSASTSNDLGSDRSCPE